MEEKISKKIEEKFFRNLASRLEEIFPKTNQDNPEIPSEGNRSGALAFNAYANIYLKEALKAQEKEVIENLKEEVEGMGKLENGTFSEKVYLNGYNQALSQVLKLIKDKQK